MRNFGFSILAITVVATSAHATGQMQLSCAQALEVKAALPDVVPLALSADQAQMLAGLAQRRETYDQAARQLSNDSFIQNFGSSYSTFTRLATRIHRWRNPIQLNEQDANIDVDATIRALIGEGIRSKKYPMGEGQPTFQLVDIPKSVIPRDAWGNGLNWEYPREKILPAIENLNGDLTMLSLGDKFLVTFQKVTFGKGSVYAQISVFNSRGESLSATLRTKELVKESTTLIMNLARQLQGIETPVEAKQDQTTSQAIPQIRIDESVVRDALAQDLDARTYKGRIALTFGQFYYGKGTVRFDVSVVTKARTTMSETIRVVRDQAGLEKIKSKIIELARVALGESTGL